MEAVYLDTSALVKRYDELERGSGRVRALCQRESGTVLIVSSLTGVEVASALNRKLRDGTLTEPGSDLGWRLFRTHQRDQYRVTYLDQAAHQAAERLVFRDILRANDALHIAGAIIARSWLQGIVRELRFCTADRAQAVAAEGEGLVTELIA